MAELFYFMAVLQFLLTIIGVFCNIVIVVKFLEDLRNVDKTRKHQHVAKSNARRECLVLIAQIALFSVGVSYALFPAETQTAVPVYHFRQAMLLITTAALTTKSVMLLRDRMILEVLVSK